MLRKVFYQNKNELGNIEDVYGTVSNYGFVVELAQNISAESFKSGDIIYGDAYNMLPLDRFLEGDKKPKARDRALNQQGMVFAQVYLNLLLTTTLLCYKLTFSH